ncbi:hypothetical protein SDJN02_03359, partial [Cucurbita argyrosperma subsp. argyrosperma]
MILLSLFLGVENSNFKTQNSKAPPKDKQRNSRMFKRSGFEDFGVCKSPRIWKNIKVSSSYHFRFILLSECKYDSDRLELKYNHKGFKLFN